MDKVTEEKNALTMKESLIQSDQNRKESFAKTAKGEKDSSSLGPAKAFDIFFDEQMKAVLDKIKLIEELNVDQNELPKHLNSLKKDINSLSEKVAISTKFLSNYTVRKSLLTIESFDNKIKVLEAKVLPKPKFGFKRKENIDAKKPTVLKDEVDSSKSIEDELNLARFNLISNSVISCGFSDKTNESLKLCDEQIANNEVELKNLENCVVFLHGNPSTVHMTNITRCKILSGPVSTSVFIENCSDSDIVVACQQLRIHSTKDSRFYIHVTSKAVIEDTLGVQFAPYNLEYDELDMQFELSGLDRSINNWDTVDDFNWLFRNTQSPNWSLISPEDRVLNWLSLINN